MFQNDHEAESIRGLSFSLSIRDTSSETKLRYTLVTLLSCVRKLYNGIVTNSYISTNPFNNFNFIHFLYR